MALSAEEKKALEDHYKNRDLYDPSKEPGQEPPSFAQAMEPAPGYAEGGDVPGIDLGDPMQFEENGFSGPSLSADTDTVKAPISVSKSAPALQMTDLGLKDALSNRIVPPQVPSAVPQPAGAPAAAAPASPAPQIVPSAPPAGMGGLSKPEFAQLLKYLQPSAGQRIGQASMSALAGLADAIETGVARTNGSNFQKNIEEGRQKQKENLLNALKAKYETGFKGQELAQGAARLAEEGRHNKEGEKETARARELTQQAQDLAMKQHAAQMGLEKGKLEAEENKTALEQAEKTGGIWNKLKGTVGLEVPGPDPKILARAQGSAAAPPASGPYGPTVVRGGKTYQWSPVSHQYHPAQ